MKNTTKIGIVLVIALIVLVGFLLRHKVSGIFNKNKPEAISPSALEAQQRVQMQTYQRPLQNHQLSIPTPSPAYYPNTLPYAGHVTLQGIKVDPVVQETEVGYGQR